jgi:hypothetical protein
MRLSLASWRLMAWILFSLSSMGAIICAAKIPPQGEVWADSHILFFVALGMMIGAVIALYQLETHTTAHIHAPLLHAWLQPMCAELKELAPELMHPHTLKKLDSIHARYFLPFNQPRWRAQFQAHIDANIALGLLDQLATGERLLHRLWSAISDNHPQESAIVYAHALALFLRLQENHCHTHASEAGT